MTVSSDKYNLLMFSSMLEAIELFIYNKNIFLQKISIYI